MKDLDDFLAECCECKRALAVKLDLLDYSSAFIEDVLGVSGSFIGLLNESYHIFLDSNRGLRITDTRCYAEKMMIKTPFLVWRNVYERS